MIVTLDIHVLSGLDMNDAMIPYMHYFLNGKVDGKKLMLMTHGDLEKLNVLKFWHKELILEAIDLLRNLVCLLITIESLYGHELLLFSTKNMFSWNTWCHLFLYSQINLSRLLSRIVSPKFCFVHLENTQWLRVFMFMDYIYIDNTFTPFMHDW